MVVDVGYLPVYLNARIVTLPTTSYTSWTLIVIRIYSAPITIIGHRCITESSELSANTERQTKNDVCLESFSKKSRIGDST